MKRFNHWFTAAITLLLAHNFSTPTSAQQGWSEGEWNEPTFTLKRVCEPKQATESNSYEIATVEGRKRKVGVLGPQPGDVSTPSAKVEFPNGLSAYLTMKADAPGAFTARGGAEIGCLVKVTITAPAKFKKPITARFNLSSPICDGYLDSFEVEIPPGTTVTRQLRGSVRVVHKHWQAKFLTYGPSWSYVRIPTGKGVTADTFRSRVEAINAIGFTMGKVSAFKSELSEQFSVRGSVGGESMLAEVVCIYEGVAVKKGAETVRATPPPPAPPVVRIPRVDPTEPQPVQVTNDSEQAEELRRQFKVEQDVRRMERRIEQTGAQLSLMAKAMAELRKKISILDGATTDESIYEVVREEVAEKVAEYRKQLAAMEEEQEKIIKKFAGEYEELTLLTKNALGKATFTKKSLQEVVTKLEAQQALLPMQMYLAADNRIGFEKASFHLLSRNEYTDAVYRLRAVNYMRSNDPRSALYALRKSLAANPNDPLTKAMTAELEVSYLRAFANKTMGDVSGVREKLNEALMGKGESGWLNAVKDIFTTGVGSCINVATGKLEAQTNLAVTLEDEAQVTHTGLLVLTRLRQKGYSWEQIKQMKGNDFANAMGRIGGATKDKPVALDDATANKMRCAMMMALQNPDVKRLQAQTKEQFDSDSDKSYFATSAFDVTWVDHAGDMVNMTNALQLIPGASIGKAGKLLGASEATQAMTVSEGLASGMRLGELGAAMEKTRAGKAALQQLTQFEKNGGIVSKMLGQAILDQGILEIGKRVGGRPGEILAEVLTTVGATDMDSLIGALQKRGFKAADAEKLIARAQRECESLASWHIKPDEYAPKLDKAMKALKSPEISPAAAKEFQDYADKLAKLQKPTLPRHGISGTSEGIRLEARKEQVLEEAFESAANGERGKVEAAKEYIETLEKEAAEQTQQLKANKENLEKIAKQLKEAEAATAQVTKNTRPPQNVNQATNQTRAPKPNAHATNQTAAPKPNSQATKDSVVPSTNTPVSDASPTNTKFSNTMRAADDAFKGGKPDLARQRLVIAQEGLKPGVHDAELAEISARLKLIDDTEKAAKETFARRVSQKPSPQNAKRSHEFSDGELGPMHGAKMEEHPVQHTSNGSESLTKPRVFYQTNPKTGKLEPVALLKPPAPNTNTGELMAASVDAELAGYHFGKALGVDVPAAARVKLKTADGEVEGVAMRYLTDFKDLAALTDAQRIALKREIARDKALSLFIGDHDRRAVNYAFTEDGRLIALDHGCGDLADSGFVQGLDGQDLEKMVQDTMDWRANYTRVCTQKVNGLDVPDPIRIVDEHIGFEDMADIVKEIKGMSDDKMKGILKEIYKGADDADKKIADALKVLKVRQGIIEETLRRHYPPLKSPASSPAHVQVP